MEGEGEDKTESESTHYSIIPYRDTPPSVACLLFPNYNVHRLL